MSVKEQDLNLFQVGKKEQYAARIIFFVAGFGISTWAPMIPKHDNLIGGQSTLSLILREILSGSMAVILPKIAPKPYTKTGGSAICRE